MIRIKIRIEVGKGSGHKRGIGQSPLKCTTTLSPFPIRGSRLIKRFNCNASEIAHVTADCLELGGYLVANLLGDA